MAHALPNIPDTKYQADALAGSFIWFFTFVLLLFFSTTAVRFFIK
jgi:hypothetical protein